MNPSPLFRPKAAALTLAALVGAQTTRAASTTIPDVPVEMQTLATPNVLVILDNSQSMDAYMGGTLVSGNNPNTRGNIGRQEMRNIIGSGTYRTAFNWGLMSFGLGAAGLYNTYAYYIGSNSGMAFTDDCVGYVGGLPQVPGVSATNGNRGCVANPQPFTGGNYVTFDKSSDDPNILDVLYDPGTWISLWGLTTGPGTSYYLYQTHNTGSGNSWATGAFSGSLGAATFTPTDAGFLSQNPPYTRQLYLPRGWGYLASITGKGTLNEAVKADSATHFNNLTSLLGSETNGNTGEIKNGAVFTPIKGTLDSALSYFSTGYQSQASPIAYSCQQNFVMLITDGLPTGDINGNLYSAADRSSSCTWSTATNQCTNGTSFGKAANDAIASVTALRTTPNAISSTLKDGTGSVTGKFDVQTYVLALGDTVNNVSALSIMNALAFYGGTGTALLATNQQQFLDAVANIATSISAKTGASAAAATSTARVSKTDNVEYATQYNAGTWWGDLTASPIDVTTGIASSAPTWSARTILDARASPATSRLIATSTDTPGATGGVDFEPTTSTAATKLSAAQQTLLNTPGVTPADGAAVLAYIRGDQSGETSGAYRVRASLLGDTVHAEPVVVKGATWFEANYADTGFGAFKAGMAGRAAMIYQGANDGMLHAFDGNGNEAWAFIPNLVMANLNNLSRKSNWTHKYYVDATPGVADVDFGSGNWHTILVGGLGKGGNGFYALDVTNPGASNEDGVAAKVLWEFPNSVANATKRAQAIKNTGLSFGKPVIVKTKAKGWVVLVTSGYNNGTNTGDSGGDGLGHLFVLDPRTGDLIADIPTAGCTTSPAANPCGLAQIEAYVPNVGGQVLDPTIDYVYGGDLYGNLWRFDFTANSTSQWSAAQFALLKDGLGTAQPITAKPKLTTITKNGVSYRFVFVGTGEYLGSPDIPGSGANSHASQTQTVYALIDDLSGATQSNPHSSTSTRTISGSGVAGAPVDCTVPMAWHMDFPGSGERLDGDPAIGLTRVGFNSIIPNTVSCTSGGNSYNYEFDIRSGCAVDSTNIVRSYLGSSRAFRPVLIQLPDGRIVEIIRMSDGSVIVRPFSSSASGSASGRRASWRELITQ